MRFLLEIVRDDSERGSFGPTFAEHVLVPSVLLIFAAAFVYGPAQSILSVAWRRVATTLLVASAAAAYFVLRPLTGAAIASVALSTSQWISLITALAAAFAWHRAVSKGAKLEGAPVQRPLSST